MLTKDAIRSVSRLALTAAFLIVATLPGLASLTEDQLRGMAIRTLQALNLNDSGFSSASISEDQESRPRGQTLYVVESSLPMVGYVTIDSKGNIVKIASHREIMHGMPPVAPGIYWSEDKLKQRALEIVGKVAPRCRDFDVVRSGMSWPVAPSYSLSLQENRGGFWGGEPVTVSLDPSNGRLKRFSTPSPYPYAATGNLISTRVAVQRARAFWEARAPAKYGKWPGDDVVAKTVGDPKWQWPWKLWDSPGTQVVLNRNEWPLAYIARVNGWEIHVNAHSGDVQGGISRLRGPTPQKPPPIEQLTTAPPRRARNFPSARPEVQLVRQIPQTIPPSEQGEGRMSRAEFRNTKFIVGLVTIVVVTVGYFLWKGRARKP